MKTSPALKKAMAKYDKETMESIRFRLPKGKRDLVKKCAEKNNESVNAMLTRLVDAEINKSLSEEEIHNVEIRIKEKK